MARSAPFRSVPLAHLDFLILGNLTKKSLVENNLRGVVDAHYVHVKGLRLISVDARFVVDVEDECLDAVEVGLGVEGNGIAGKSTANVCAFPKMK